MSHASFENFLYAPASSPRSARLAAATVIACSTLAIGLALAFSFERLAVLRMPGPKTRFELAAVVIADPPKVADPPAKPEDQAAGATVDDTPTILRRSNPAAADRDVAELGESVRDGNDLVGLGNETGIPDGGRTGPPCPGGICAKGPIGIPYGTGTGTSVAELAPPKPLPLASLRCLVCADPNVEALRRTAAGVRKTSGTNVTKFCVDATGRVEAESVRTGTSHGDSAIDRLCREAVETWRFSPTKVAGVGRRACSQATFRIRFE